MTRHVAAVTIACGLLSMQEFLKTFGKHYAVWRREDGTLYIDVIHNNSSELDRQRCYTPQGWLRRYSHQSPRHTIMAIRHAGNLVRSYSAEFQHGQVMFRFVGTSQSDSKPVSREPVLSSPQRAPAGRHEESDAVRKAGRARPESMETTAPAATLNASVTSPQPVSALRARRWIDLPSTPGVYWWYFSETDLRRFRIAEFCETDRLRLRRSEGGRLCLYCGMAANLAERVAWHAEQNLTAGVLRSGFLSTFRLTLLALNGFEYTAGRQEIDRFMDELFLSWVQARSRTEAAGIESSELSGEFQFPLNIRQNQCVELRQYIRFLSNIRKNYKRRYL